MELKGHSLRVSVEFAAEHEAVRRILIPIVLREYLGIPWLPKVVCLAVG